ncbi:MAG: DUF2807 domain-containing protein [Bacteroidales bacterium]|nr:DUF2807 domain-containing protein [Bacteroidales bacterium]MCF8404649.1 DUF2807 domain-containing protein [Bacteroidales bacterium]
MKTTRILFLILLAILSVILITSCTKDGRRIKGQGPIVEQAFDIPPISGVSLSIDASVIIVKGDTQSVIIEGQQNIIDNIEKYVTSEGLWRIGYYRPVTNHAGVVIQITTPNFDFATVSGSGKIETKDHFTAMGDVYAKISGSGSIILSVNAQRVESEISGSGQIYLTGEAYEQYIDISGSGNVRALNLETQKTYITISGSGNSEVFVQDYLEVGISGSGNVYYKGNPQINANISGSGGIINWN